MDRNYFDDIWRINHSEALNLKMMYTTYNFSNETFLNLI